MPNFYAQIDDRRICVAILDMGAIYDNPLYYPIADYNLDLISTQLDISILPGTTVDENDFNDIDLSTIPIELDEEFSASSSKMCSLTFPETLVFTHNINLKGNRMRTYNTDSSYFWSYFAYGGTYEYWDATILTFTDNTSDQTIVDLTGSGVITNIICPVPDTDNSTVTVTVTADGIPYTFSSRSNNNDSRYCLGYLAPEYDSSDDDDDQISYPSSNWKESDREMYVLVPPTALNRGKTGIIFNNSIKVEIRSDSGWSTSNRDCYGGVSYLTYVPFGL